MVLKKIILVAVSVITVFSASSAFAHQSSHHYNKHYHAKKHHRQNCTPKKKVHHNRIPVARVINRTIAAPVPYYHNKRYIRHLKRRLAQQKHNHNHNHLSAISWSIGGRF